MVLFIIAPKWKEPRYPSVGKWLGTLWYDHLNVEYASATERDEVPRHRAAWRNGNNCTE